MFCGHMDLDFENLLLNWPLCVIRDVDITASISDSAPRRYAIVNRALKSGVLVRLRRGVYLIEKPFRKATASNFEIAHFIYGPSYVSFESSLFYHQWIPEAVYTTTCATSKRAAEFETPLGMFTYTHVPEHLCYLGVQRIGGDHDAFYIADPWKALADHYYVHNRNWNRVEDLYLDMRIEMETMQESDLTQLRSLSENYQSRKVRNFLCKLLKSIADGNKSH